MKRQRPARVVLATHNRHKLREARKILRPILVFGLDRFPPYTVRETGKTLEENALLKVRVGAHRTGWVCLADDTGLEVKALGGAPGVLSARFAGPGCDYAANNRKLLRVLRPMTGRRRTAVFRCVVGVVFPDGTERVVEGTCPGRIAPAARGTKGFGYDPVFQPIGSKKTFAEMTLAEKNRISHRFRAFAKARDYLIRTYRRSPNLFQPAV